MRVAGAAGARAADMRMAGRRLADMPEGDPAARRLDSLMPRPVWLLAEPVPLAAADLHQLQQGSLVLEMGPERIESGWWDGNGVARDYYGARPAQGGAVVDLSGAPDPRLVSARPVRLRPACTPNCMR